MLIQNMYDIVEDVSYGCILYKGIKKEIYICILLGKCVWFIEVDIEQTGIYSIYLYFRVRVWEIDLKCNIAKSSVNEFLLPAA